MDVIDTSIAQINKAKGSLAVPASNKSGKDVGSLYESQHSDFYQLEPSKEISGSFSVIPNMNELANFESISKRCDELVSENQDLKELNDQLTV